MWPCSDGRSTKRIRSPTERRALGDQRAELEDLKRQLSSGSPQSRSARTSLRAAHDGDSSGQASPTVLLPPVGDPRRTGSRRGRPRWRSESARSQRERPRPRLAAANGCGRHSVRRTRGGVRERESALAARESELEARERDVAERERIPADPDAARLAQIEITPRRARAAEEAFLRTRRDLAEHSDAITAREQLLAQRERELDEREDGWGGPELRDLESRLRRLETQRLTGGEQTRSFSGGFKKLEQEGTRKPQG